jgi:hypothetical protein
MQLSTDPQSDGVAIADATRSPSPSIVRWLLSDRAARARFLVFLVIAAPILIFGLKPPDPFDSPLQFAGRMLHGYLYFDQDTPYWEMFHRDGRWYVPYAPLASVLLIPYAAIGGEKLGLGLANTSFILAATATLWALFRSSRPLRPWAEVAAAAYLIGTPFLYSCAVGNCWLLLHSEENLCLFAALLALQKRKWVWLGCFYAMAVLCRYGVGFSVPMLLPALVGGLMPWRLPPAGRSRHWRRFRRRATWFLIGALPPIIAIFCLNWAMTGQPFLSTYELTYTQWGVADKMYSPDYFMANLRLYFGSMPIWLGRPPYLRFDIGGEAFWVMSPFFVYLLAMRPRTRLLRCAVVGAVLTIVPYLFFKWSGYGQVGCRYATDTYPFLMPLTFSAVAFRRSPKWRALRVGLLALLIAFAFAINILAAVLRHTDKMGFG